MLLYNDLIKIINNQQNNNLLLGAGFSMAFSKKMILNENDYFSNCSDEEKAKKNREKDRNTIKSKNYNVNLVGNRLYTKKGKTIVEDLSLYHPKGICEIKQEEANNCFDFLYVFLKTGKVFTLNYDLLLYWASVRAREASNILYKDGFDLLNSTRNGWVWNDDESINIYYCHGALNLYSSKSKCYKSAHDQLCFLPLQQTIMSNNLPLFVSQPSSTKKREAINRSNYLSSCFRTLKSVSGNLVVLGFGANENDSHIMDAIKNSQEKNNTCIYFGLFKEGNDWETVKKRVEDSGLIVQFFDSSSAHIWR